MSIRVISLFFVVQWMIVKKWTSKYCYPNIQISNIECFDAAMKMKIKWDRPQIN